MSEKIRKRQLQILLKLKSGQILTAVELANQFQVSIRTILRDAEMMLETGIPIQTLQGRGGGFRLVTNDPLESTNPDPDLALRFFLMEYWKPDGLASGANTTSLRKKTASKREYLQLLDRIHFDTNDWYWRDEGSTHIQAVRRALQTNTMLEVTFREAQGGSRKPSFLRPLGLVWKAGQWYLIASQSLRIIERFSLNAFSDVQMADAQFAYPPEFQLREWWLEEMERYGSGDTRVVLQAAQSASDELSRLSYKKTSVVDFNPDGSMSISLFVDNWGWLVPLVASYGPALLVKEPAELAGAVQAHLRQALAQYGSTTKVGPSDLGFEQDDSRLRTTRGRPNDRE